MSVLFYLLDISDPVMMDREMLAEVIDSNLWIAAVKLTYHAKSDDPEMLVWTGVGKKGKEISGTFRYLYDSKGEFR